MLKVATLTFVFVNSVALVRLKTNVSSLAVLMMLCLLTGCESLGYYSHVAKGQWQLLQARQPIAELVVNPATDAHLKQRLRSIQMMRSFASRELLLADNSYRDYVALDRPYVVWNVFAASAFSVTPEQWCFPVAGCVSYRGYFSEQKARNFAEGLSTQGYEVYVAGVSAYSTLGWFDDPVLSTFLYRDDIQLAGLIFHELAHQLLYVAGDTTFNESFASTVEQEGIRRWLQYQQQPEQQSALVLQQYFRHQQMQQDFVTTLLDLREQLNNLYQKPLNHQSMRIKKQQLLAAFKSGSYQVFKARWQTDRYDKWIESGLNNAKLSTVASYHQWLPAFEQLLILSEDLTDFYQRAIKLSKLSPELRQQALQSLLNKHQQLN